MNDWEKTVLTKLKEILAGLDYIVDEIEKINTSLDKLYKETT